MIYRLAGIEDLEGIMALEKDSLEHPWSKEDVRVMLTSNRYNAIVCVDVDRIVGYAGASYVIDEAEIGNICVNSEYRRQGIGSRIWRELEANLRCKNVKTVFLEVEESNASARAMYEKLGFVSYNVRQDYYGHKKSAVLMKNNL